MEVQASDHHLPSWPFALSWPGVSTNSTDLLARRLGHAKLTCKTQIMIWSCLWLALLALAFPSGIQLVYSCAFGDVNNEIVKCWQINLRISRRFTYANERHLSQIHPRTEPLCGIFLKCAAIHVGSHKCVCSSVLLVSCFLLWLGVVVCRSFVGQLRLEPGRAPRQIAKWKNLSRNTKLPKGAPEWRVSWNGSDSSSSHKYLWILMLNSPCEHCTFSAGKLFSGKVCNITRKTIKMSKLIYLILNSYRNLTIVNNKIDKLSSKI